MDQSDLIGSSIIQNLSYTMIGMQKMYDCDDNQMESVCMVRYTKNGDDYPVPFIQKVQKNNETSKSEILYDYKIEKYLATNNETNINKSNNKFCTNSDSIKNIIIFNRDEDPNKRYFTQELMSHYCVSKNTIVRIINELVEENVLEKNGNGKNTYYTYVKKDDAETLNKQDIVDCGDDFDND